MNPKPQKHWPDREVADAVFSVAGILGLAILFAWCIAITTQFVAGEYHPRLNIACLFWIVVMFGASYWGWRNR